MGLWSVPAWGQFVALQNATASFSQINTDFPGLWGPAKTIDGVTDGYFTSWAVNHAPPNTPETIVWETVENLDLSGHPPLAFSLHHGDYVPSPGHNLGRFRLSYTTDDRSLFADGLASGGDVTANWVVIEPTAMSTGNSQVSMDLLSDGSILVGGLLEAYPTYLLHGNVTALGITGFRLEVLLDDSLPFDGPGRQPVNGNLHLSEFRVQVVPEPWQHSLVSAGLLLGWGFFHRKR